MRFLLLYLLGSVLCLSQTNQFVYYQGENPSLPYQSPSYPISTNTWYSPATGSIVSFSGNVGHDYDSYSGAAYEMAYLDSNGGVINESSHQVLYEDYTARVQADIDSNLQSSGIDFSQDFFSLGKMGLTPGEYGSSKDSSLISQTDRFKGALLGYSSSDYSWSDSSESLPFAGSGGSATYDPLGGLPSTSTTDWASLRSSVNASISSSFSNSSGGVYVETGKVGPGATISLPFGYVGSVRSGLSLANITCPLPADVTNGVLYNVLTLIYYMIAYAVIFFRVIKMVERI